METNNANNAAQTALAESLKKEMRMFISTFDIEYRKQLFLAIKNSFRTVINTQGQNVNYSGYIDKFTQLQSFLNKAASEGYLSEFYKACDIDKNTNYMMFTMMELKKSIEAEQKEKEKKDANKNIKK
jgi:hypothetical protein